ncbi:30S ribosomal protein S6 [Candidatus Gracilibacteria bacterium]|nr:30S ribosomal protein S6 [Candidatus Gracilibacteria bacterium]
MKQYELMLILSPSISEEDRNESLAHLKSILETNGATIKKEDVWGEKKLAYKINTSSTGYYVLMDLELDGTKIKPISKEMNLDKNIWRYMFAKLED